METELKETLKKLLICAYVIIALLAVNTVVTFISNVEVTKESEKTTETEETQTNTEYDVSMFDTVDAEKVVKLFDEDETQVIYVGRETCGYCVQFLPALQQAQKDYGYKTKYLDITTVTEDGQKAILEKDNDEDFLATNFGSTPMVILVKDGKIVDGWVGYAEYETFAQFLEENGFKK
ncbi:MAG: hypothetical protein E7157_00805 [Lactobacillales bacterium]|nr:hypothetical protein [Lactobacillales bacterium]